ncbi:MAG: hypothetical protein ACREP9_16805, partial [Candidatus Dormibacteraceae bacterium]
MVTNRRSRRPARRLKTEHAVPILMYHSVDEQAAPAFSRFTMHPRSFAEQLCWLAEHGYNGMTVTELAWCQV